TLPADGIRRASPPAPTRTGVTAFSARTPACVQLPKGHRRGRPMAADDLAPGMLLAAPALNDPNFAKSGILLGRNDSDGSLGWVINGRQLTPVHELLRTSELIPAGAAVPKSTAFERRATVGGPVANNAAWLLYRRQSDPLSGELPV